jgi:hypothetical protein
VFAAFSFRTETGNWAVFQDDLVEVPPPLVRAPPSVDIPRLLHPYQRGRRRNSNVRR